MYHHQTVKLAESFSMPEGHQGNVRVWKRSKNVGLRAAWFETCYYPGLYGYHAIMPDRTLPGLATNLNSILLTFRNQGLMLKSAFSTNAQTRVATVVVDGVLGPLRLAQHT